MTHSQPRNYAALLAKVFDEEPKEILTRWGFPDGHRRCTCGRELSGQNKSGVCWPCKQKMAHILLTCEECGIQFWRRTSQVIFHRGKRGANHIWCGKVCQGKQLGHHNKKHNYEAVWAAHLRTGYGSSRLGLLLGIPSTSISPILRQFRLAQERSGGG